MLYSSKYGNIHIPKQEEEKTMTKQEIFKEATKKLNEKKIALHKGEPERKLYDEGLITYDEFLELEGK